MSASRKVSLALLVATSGVGLFALAGGTRSLTDVKAPLVAAGALLAGISALLLVLYERERSLAGCGILFVLAVASRLSLTALSPLWSDRAWIAHYVLAERFLMLTLALSLSVVAVGAFQWRIIAWSWAVMGAAVALLSLVWHGIYVPMRLVGLSQGLSFVDALAHSLRNVRAPLGNANLLGGFLLLPMAMATGLVMREWSGGRRTRTLALLAVLVAPVIPVFFLCRSLSAYGGLAVATAALFFLRSRRKVRAAVLIVLAAGVIASAAYFSGAFAGLRSSRSYLLRLEYWRRAVVMGRQRSLLGWGAGNYYTSNQPLGADTNFKEVIFDDSSGPRPVPLYEVLGNHHPSASHNAYLDEAAEGGLVGLGIFLLLLAVPLVRGMAGRRAGFAERGLLDAALATYVGFLFVIGVTMNLRFADFAPQFWLLCGLLVSSGSAAEEKHRLRMKPPGALGRLVTVGIAVAGVCWGIYEFAYRDWRASRDFHAATSLHLQRDPDRAEELLRAAEEHTWDPRLRTGALEMTGWSYLLRPEPRLQSAHVVAEELGALVAGYNALLLGETLERAGDYAGALEAYRRHARVRPAEPGIRARVRFVEAMIALEAAEAGAYERGIEHFRLHPGQKSRLRAYYLRLLEDGRDALGPLAVLAGGLDEDHPDERYLIGRLRFLEGDYQQAARLMQEAFDAGCRLTGINRFRVLAYLELGELENAQEALRQGRILSPQCENLVKLERLITARKTGDEDAGGDGHP